MNILSLTYLGNIQWFSKLCFSECLIDVDEHYVKQSYRNRCDILTANGPASLTVNTVRTSNWNKVSVRDTRIDYSKRWQHLHWQSLVSAYRNSPYFDHYASEFEPFYHKHYDFLLDFDMGLLETVLRLVGSDVEIKISDKYIDHISSDMSDWRNGISDKPRLSRPDPEFTAEPYWQVFSDRMDFVPNLSIVDLLFCEGPGALDIIRESRNNGLQAAAE